ncbi:MAG: hypothetical protein NTY53_00720, partial [Kiritimatiellaeota bacterium]|nr:hypothetical protein [Kiritimatiellota bacterium]
MSKVLGIDLGTTNS